DEIAKDARADLLAAVARVRVVGVVAHAVRALRAAQRGVHAGIRQRLAGARSRRWHRRDALLEVADLVEVPLDAGPVRAAEALYQRVRADLDEVDDALPLAPLEILLRGLGGIRRRLEVVEEVVIGLVRAHRGGDRDRQRSGAAVLVREDIASIGSR